MKIVKEAFSPPQHLINRINEVASTIQPDNQELRSWYEAYTNSHSTRLAFDLAMVTNYAKEGQRILEFGSVPPVLTAALKNSNYEVKGLDIAPERFSKAIKELELEVKKCNVEIESIPYDDNYFDVIIFNELFEHLRINPIFTLKETLRVLKPGGKLLLSTPNLRSLYGIKNFLFNNLCYSCSPGVYSQYEKLETLGHMGHVREYTSKEVVIFLEKIGFSVQELVYRGRFGTGFEQALARLFPSVRPFVSVIGVKL